MKLLYLFWTIAIIASLADCRLVVRDVDHDDTVNNIDEVGRTDKDTVYSNLGYGELPVPNLNFKPLSSTVNSTVVVVNTTATPYLDIKRIPSENENGTVSSTVRPNTQATTTSQVDSTPDAVTNIDQAVLIMVPKRLIVEEGEMAQFNCVLTSRNFNNFVKIRWFRHNQDLMNVLYSSEEYKYSRYGFETGQEPASPETGWKTFWSVLTIFETALTDYGKFTCDVNDYMEIDADLIVQVRPLSSKKQCVDSGDCSWRSNYKCVNYICQPTSLPPSIYSHPTDSSSPYATSLRFTVAAFLCGGLVITIVMFVILFREVCYKFCENPRRPRRARNGRRSQQFVYVIGRENAGDGAAIGSMSDPIDKPPNYEACISNLTAATTSKDETPPPTYREQKKRAIPPPPYDAFLTSQAEMGGASGTTTCSQHEGTSPTTQSNVTAAAAETTFPKELPK